MSRHACSRVAVQGPHLQLELTGQAAYVCISTPCTPSGMPAKVAQPPQPRHCLHVYGCCCCCCCCCCLPRPQKQKKAERKKRETEAARAEELGLEPPPKKQQKVRPQQLRGCEGCSQAPKVIGSMQQQQQQQQQVRWEGAATQEAAEGEATAEGGGCVVLPAVRSQYTAAAAAAAAAAVEGAMGWSSHPRAARGALQDQEQALGTTG
jgi:hypothetical protein